MNCSDDKERRRETTAMETPDVPFAIDVAHSQVLIAGRPVTLRATEFRILQLLASAPNRTFTRIEILDGINVGDYAIGERAVDVQIVSLRKKLGPAANRIETVYGQGYRRRGP
jgi:two-component system phosphate regulon response regulator PhoB